MTPARGSTAAYRAAAVAVAGAALVALAARASGASAGRAAPPTMATLLLGRQMVIDHGCSGCHGGGENVAGAGYLGGTTGPDDEFLIGPCATKLDAKPCFRTWARNITPDNVTGIGRFSERQIFNALRYGLRPGETPDVDITSSTPGQGNFPATPKYLAPPMPWPAWRHMSDAQLWAIAAYLKYAVKPIRNRVPDSEGPPDFWASTYTVANIGAYPAPAFPTANEVAPAGITAQAPAAPKEKP